MDIKHKILPLTIKVITNIYWVLNVIVLIVLTFYKPGNISPEEGCGIICKIQCFMNEFTEFVYSIQLCGDRLTWFGIITALWISGLTIIVFILGKTNDIIYGIKFSNIIIWQVTLPGVICSGIIYTVLFPWGFWSCFCGIYGFIFIDIFMIFSWLAGTSFFIIYYSKKTNTYEAIRRNTLSRAKKICRSDIDFDTDYLGRVNQFPLIKMIRCLESNDSEETQRVKECMIDICSLFDEENVAYQYMILMPIISAYCEKSGFKTRYEASGTADFFADLLRHKWAKECRLWIRVGIILPILEKWRGADTGIDIVNILKYFPMSERQQLVLVILLYIEYLRCCGDEGEEYIIALKKIDLPRVVRECVIDEKGQTLYGFWLSWNLLDHQENYHFDIFNHFVDDCNNWKNKNYAHQTWILKRVMWEEIRHD